MTRQTLLTMILGVCTPGLVLTSCQDSTATEAAEQQAPPTVKVFNIIEQKVTDYGEWFAYLRGEMDTDIHPRVTGFLIEQEYKDGQFKKAGDVLFRIDPSLFEAQLAQAKANLAAAEAALIAVQAQREKAQLDVKRYEGLKEGVVSEKDLSDARQTLKAELANEKAAAANVELMKAAVNQAQIDLDYTVIRAPYDGIVGAAKASQGDLVSPSTTLANITAVQPIRATFSINARKLLDTLRKYGDMPTAENSPPVYLVTEDGEQYPYAGHLAAVESKLSSNGLIDMEASFPNPENALRAGMTVRLRIPVDEKEALLVPQDAIRQVLRNNFILVVDKQSVPHMVPVSIVGTYPVTVKEADGFESQQKMVAISNYGSNKLADLFRQYGYEKATEVPVVTDRDNSVHAMNISSANSRLAKGEKPGTVGTAAFTFNPGVNAALAAAKAANAAPKKEGPAPKPSLPPFPVETVHFLQQDVELPAEWYGSLRGEQETEIRPRVGGFLTSQHFKDGSMVKKGDVLFTIDPASYEAALAQARANLAAAKAAKEQTAAQLEMNKLNYQRYERLNKETPGAVSEKAVTDAATAVKTSEAALLKAAATVEQMEAAVKLAEINLSYTTITAPFDGRIGIRKASPGQLVSPDSPAPLVTLSSVNPMRVDFNVSGKNALRGFTRFSRNKAAGTPEKEDFEIMFGDGTMYSKKGTVVTADNALSKTTGTLKVIGRVDNTDGKLRSGMPVRVRAALKGGKNAILVPARAPLNSKGMDMIVTLRPDNTPDIIPITKGAIVNIPVANPDGTTIVQPMQIIQADRAVMTEGLLSKTGAPSLEAVILGGAKAKSWKDLVLSKAGAASTRELMEKQAGTALPDDLPAQEKAADWDALFLKKAGATDFRNLVLKQADATDELDLIAKGQGCNSALEMMLKGMGYPDLASARVVAEGSLMAAQTYQANMAAGARVNKLTPKPFIYTIPRTVVPSVTAEPEK